MRLAGRRELTGSRRGAVGRALRVNVLIRRGLREDAASGPLTPSARHPMLRPGFVRRLSGGGLSREVRPCGEL